jgi:hypothetical protein
VSRNLIGLVLRFTVFTFAYTSMIDYIHMSEFMELSSGVETAQGGIFYGICILLGEMNQWMMIIL